MKLRLTKSKKLYKTAEQLMPGGVNSPVRSFKAVSGTPVFISRGKGQYIYDADGNKYTDYMSSWGPLILGHAAPAVVRAVKKAAEKGTSYGAPCEDEIELAKLIVKAFPSIDMVRMTSSGTEATMSGVRLARAYTKRDYIVKFEGCYHGHADYLLVQAGSGATTFGTPSSPGVPESFTEKTLLANYNDLDSVRGLYDKYRDKIAAVIIEPVAANMGVVPPADGFLEGLRKITRDSGSLLIFDEVITGFRLGMGGAQHKYGVKPDITCLGKIIGGGLPVGAFGGKKDIMSMVAPLGPMYQAGTLSGNPLAMAAGLATLRKLKEPGNYKKLRGLSLNMVEGIKEIIKELGISACVNSVESMFTIFFTEPNPVDYRTVLKSDTKKYSKFFENLLRAGIMFPPSQFEAVFLSLAHTDRDVDRTLDVVHKALKAV
ncbi:MAG: glutamate-1-semialdehyde-2,1-aminomutase [Candidatus Dadabacteria bacterium RIFCSPHIGHO2_12_FULL_53_21]|nr:MAG: glutamate-1-semialdehyde-2,1-aminomutase [Candidatus Dadabacteria bacterium RIFCSPHIGHO2_12_FULL_53_21]